MPVFVAEPVTLTQITLRRGAAEGFAQALGMAVPAPGRVSTGQGRELLWVQPGTFLLIGNRVEALAPFATTVDQTDGRSCFHLDGPQAIEILSRGCRVDFHPRAFGPGRVAATSLAHVNALIQQRDATPRFRIIVFSSFARHISEWLEHAAAGA